MTYEVSSDHKDFITVWEVSNLPVNEFGRGFFWEIITWIVKNEIHFHREYEGRLNHSHPLEPLALVNISIMAFTILHLFCHYSNQFYILIFIFIEI